ncbi:phage portal protein [Streptomyces sp. NPDC006784]|uniref:phage portal protein n=1 Tax=Streptomyces sp. NPDC006784 TaxID=3364764 RepID=UPI0036B08134
MGSPDLMHGIAELEAARAPYVEAENMYRGTVEEVFASARLQRALEQSGINFRLNFAKTPVNAVVDRLEIASITGTDDAHTRLISQVWKDNELDLEAPDLHRKACYFGDAYLIEVPVEDDNGQVIGVEMHYNSPLTVRAIYSQENPRVVDYYIKHWTERTSLGQIQRAELYYDDRTERWTTKPGAKGEQAADWVHWTAAPEDDEPEDEDSWTIPNPHGQMVFHFRTERPFGVPEHFDAYGPQNAINKLAISQMSTIDFQIAPQRYAITDSATTDTSDVEPGDFDDFPPDDATDGPTDTGDDSSLKAGPGEVWLLRGYKAVGQLDPAKPEVFLNPLTFEVRAMSQITTTPLYLFDTEGGQEISGESRRQKDAAFVKKIRNRQMSFGATWRAVFTFALKLLGYPDATVDVRWAPAATVEDKTGWETTGLKVENGVPRRQALLEAGYREEQVDDWLTGVDEAELERRVTILATLADSAQKLGSAAALGVVTTGQVQGLLAGALSDVELLAPETETETADA